ncbi:MAG: type IV secretory system conjugative DNA transfer family protein [Gammaproteobacteria bacterium]|nr:type IV secretory system conjugative DNA transfer family protein [Gammaproteobacteria bacterium]
MRNSFKFTFALLVFVFGLSACVQDKPAIPAFELKARAFKVNYIRQNIIKETAQSVGAQAALAWSSENINKLLESQSEYLAEVYNFQMMMLDHNVVSPVLVEADNALNVDDNSTLRLADKIYKILKPARFATVTPSWRDYLWMNYKSPETPDGSLLPKNNYEKALWNKYILKGWKDGLRQADEVFSININRLNRDFQGMILYQKLLSQKLVTKPFVSKADLGITGDSNNLRINDRVLRITAVAHLVKNSRKWEPRIYASHYLKHHKKITRKLKSKVHHYTRGKIIDYKNVSNHTIYYGKKRAPAAHR